MKKIFDKISFIFEYYILCQGDLINYLRRQGVRIGQDCQLLNRAYNFGTEPWLIEIGNHVTVTSDVFLITHDASSRLFRKTLPDSSPFGNRFGKINILDNCFIGVGSIILPDVTIGPNSIVGAGSVVVKDVLPNTVVAGVPARVIASLDEYIEKYKEKMVPIKSKNRQELRHELTRHFWGEDR